MATDSNKRQVAIKRVDETEVYFNDELEIVIKQTDMYGEESHVIFCASYAPAVIAAIQRTAGEISDMEEDQA